MPLIHVIAQKTPADAERVSAMLRKLSATLARELKKPESYVMTCLTSEARMTFAGTDAPTCYAEVKNIGALSEGTSSRLSAALSSVLSEGLEVPKNRIYIEFSDVAAHLWGFDGGTFA